MPVVGLATGGTDFTNMFVVLRDGVKAAAPYASLADAKAAGATVIAYGSFVDPGDSVPDPGVGRVPDGEGRQSLAGTGALRRRRQPDVPDVMAAVPRIEL